MQVFVYLLRSWCSISPIAYAVAALQQDIRGFFTRLIIFIRSEHHTGSSSLSVHTVSGWQQQTVKYRSWPRESVSRRRDAARSLISCPAAWDIDLRRRHEIGGVPPSTGRNLGHRAPRYLTQDLTLTLTVNPNHNPNHNSKPWPKSLVQTFLTFFKKMC